METSVSSSSSWQRTLYQQPPQFDQTLAQTPQYGRYISTDPNWRQGEESVSDRVRGGEGVGQRQCVDHPNSVPPAHPIARRYHQHEEDQTEFRAQGASGLDQDDWDTQENEPENDSFLVGRREGSASASRHSQHYDRHAAYTDSDIYGPLNGGNGNCKLDDPSRLRDRDTGSSSAVVVNNTRYTSDGRHKQGGVGGDSVEENCVSEEEEDVDQRFYREDFAEHSWRAEHDGVDGEGSEWKRPGIHMFKASSCKGSVTSERSSRLDPHTYQSYAAGLLYSSGRSEKFLKLQNNFAVLERIGELDKSSMQKETEREKLPWQELGASRQSFQSEEELQELYTELKEAKKKKEFFHDTDKQGQVMWKPEKDFGLKNREHTLKDQVVTYRNLVEDKSTKSPSSASKADKMKRALSFGELYDKFHKSETPDPVQESPRVSPRSHETERKGILEATASHSSKPAYSEPRAEETDQHSGGSVKQSVSSLSPVCYLQLMESAAKKSRQRAVHGTHMDSPCNDYEAYVNQVKKVNKEDSELHFHPSPHKPWGHQTNPEPHDSGSKEKTRSSEELLQDPRYHRNVHGEKTYRSEESLQASRDSRNLHGEKTYHSKESQQESRDSRNLHSEKTYHGKESQQESASPRNLHSAKTYHSKEPLETCGNVRNMHSAGTEIVIDSSSIPKPGLTVKSEEDCGDRQQGVRPVSSGGPVRPVSSGGPAVVQLDTQQGRGREVRSVDHPEDLDSTDTSQSECGQERPATYSDMPDIIQMDKHRKPLKTSSTDPNLFKTTLPASVKSESRSRPHSTYRAYGDFGRDDDTSKSASWKRPPSGYGAYGDLEREDASQSESRKRPQSTYGAFADLDREDIAKSDSHKRPQSTYMAYSNLDQKDNQSASWNRPQSGYGAYAAPDREGESKSYSHQKQNQTPDYKQDTTPKSAEALQQTVEPNRTRPSEKGTVFQVRDLRNLAENNEFSINPLSWMKKPTTASPANKEAVGGRKRVQDVAASEPYNTPPQFRGGVESRNFPASKADVEKSSAAFLSQDLPPWAHPTGSTPGRFTTPAESSDRSVNVEKKAPPSYKKPDPLSYQPLPSQSGPTFSASRRGVESRTKEMENTRYVNSAPGNAQPYSRYSPNIPERNVQQGFSESNKGREPAESTQTKGASYTPAAGTSQKPEWEGRDPGRGRRPGDGSDSQSSQSSDQQYGQLRKWTAVADIYKDADKSWSPTRETPSSFPPENNNSSISSTDTFIVKETDGDQDDLESSMSSVSRLRQIFERQQKVSKSRSEPDLWSDSNEEPRRPRSAKSQADLSSAHKEEASLRPGIPRTVSGDLREVRHQYQDRPDQYQDRPDVSDRQFSDFEPTEHGRPTDVALRAWVHYTDRQRYDPYLPPEDILKEVSSASSGRKLDVPRPKNYRPSNVSKMTLEYFNQIGSEWQQSGNRGFIPQHTQQGSGVAQPGIQHVDRRYVSHQYVNEENPFASIYPQTDDHKLKQSQWAGASGLGKEAEHRFEDYKPSYERLEYSAVSQQHEPVSTRPWTPSGVSRSQPVKTLSKQSEATTPSQTPDRQAYSGAPALRQPASQPVSSDSKPAPTPAQRSKLQPWRPQFPQTKSENSPLHPAQSSTSPAASLSIQNSSVVVNQPPATSGHFAQNETPGTRRNQKGDPEDAHSIPPEPSRLPPLSPKQQPRTLPRRLQHSRSKSSDSERSSGDYGGVYCVSTGSVLYGEADEVFKHQTTDERRIRTEPIDPEKEWRRKQEEEAYRKKRLEELYEEERLKKMRRDEADAEARRHHDFYTTAQKSPISPNRFDEGPSSLSPSTPGSLGTLERKGPQLSIPPERRRGFQIQGKARALFSFTAQNPRELSFRKNDIIYLLRLVDKNWFEGERHGLVGIFPNNYVEVVTSIEAAQAAAMQAEGQGRAKYGFTAQSSVELSLRKGEFVVLLRRVDENWYEGRIGNRQGIFPVSYVEITREPSTPLVTPAPSVITTPMTGTPEMLSPVGYDAAPTPPPQPSPSALAYQQRSPYPYPQPPQLHPGYGPTPGGGGGSLLTPATSSLSRGRQDFGQGPRSPISHPKSPVSPSGRQTGSPGRRLTPGPPQVSSSSSSSVGPTSRLHVDIQSSAKPFANGPPASSSSSSSAKVLDDDLALTRYRAVYAYRPQNEDELELRDGDEVFVMEMCDDGWFVGTSARSGCFGTFPGNYVQKIFMHSG